MNSVGGGQGGRMRNSLKKLIFSYKCLLSNYTTLILRTFVNLFADKNTVTVFVLNSYTVLLRIYVQALDLGRAPPRPCLSVSVSARVREGSASSAHVDHY